MYNKFTMKMLHDLPEVKIAITGPIGIGKSTIVNTLLTYLGEKPLGFRTLPVIKNDTLHSFEIVNLYTFERASIGVFEENFVIKPVTASFETIGVNALNVALEKGKVILMDELGFLEKDATNFKNKVFEVLKSKKFVLYVVKEELNEFLKEALSIADLVFQVSKENRNSLAKKILEEIWVYTRIS